MKVAVAALAALALAGPTWAAETANPLARDKVVLDLKGLDLATVDGQRHLAIRMDQAARAVCGDRVATIHLALEEQSRACQAEVIADIRSRIETRTAAVVPKAATPTLVALR